MKRFVLYALVGLFSLALLGFLDRITAQDKPAATRDSWYCATSSFDEPVCFQFGKVALVAPQSGYISLVSGDRFEMDKSDFVRLLKESQGMITAGLSGAVAKK